MTRTSFKARMLRDETRRAPTALRVGSWIALLAVLAQIALPHLHQWISGDGDDPSVPAARTITAGGEHELAAPCSDHADWDCATCQALAQTRSFVTTRVEPPRPAVLSTGTFARWHTPCAPVRTVAHAPRSPPAAA